jgi:hypothetical protein
MNLYRCDPRPPQAGSIVPVTLPGGAISVRLLDTSYCHHGAVDAVA